MCDPIIIPAPVEILQCVQGLKAQQSLFSDMLDLRSVPAAGPDPYQHDILLEQQLERIHERCTEQISLIKHATMASEAVATEFRKTLEEQDKEALNTLAIVSRTYADLLAIHSDIFAIAQHSKKALKEEKEKAALHPWTPVSTPVTPGAASHSGADPVKRELSFREQSGRTPETKELTFMEQLDRTPKAKELMEKAVSMSPQMAQVWAEAKRIHSSS